MSDKEMREAVKDLREALMRDGVSVPVQDQVVVVFEAHLGAVVQAERARILSALGPVLLEAENMLLHDGVTMIERGFAHVRDRLTGKS